MVIGACTLYLVLPGVSSLKEKRSLLKPLLIQLRRRFEVAAAEIAQQDARQHAALALVSVANDDAHVYRVLEAAVRWVEESNPALVVADWSIELR